MAGNRLSTVALLVDMRYVTINLQREEMIKNVVLRYEKITRADVIELYRVAKDQAYIILSSMVKKGILKKSGELRYSFYILNA